MGSAPGRFFYTLISAMSQWEREEISSRVQASVPIRAKLGKSLGGDTPFGYERVHKELVLHPLEAPIRKLVYELFAEHKRKKKVVKILNERGYRTRKGGLFSDTTVDRFLRDPISKGIRRVNYTKGLGDKQHWTLKPADEWIFVPVPRIVSDELWQTCNDMLDSMTRNLNKVRSRGVYLFAGVLTCQCGSKMYMRSKSPRYVCGSCKNKIEPDILEEVFHEQLKQFLFSDTEIQKKLDADTEIITHKEELLTALKQTTQKLQEKIDKTFELYYDNKLTKEAFEIRHQPLYQEQQQKLVEIADIQSTLDVLAINSLSSSQVLHDAKNLYYHWHNFSHTDKKNIIEQTVKNITISFDTIDIELAYLPMLPKASETENLKDSPMGDNMQQTPMDMGHLNLVRFRYTC